MSRIPVPTLDNSPADSRPILDAVNQQLGSVPNLFRLLGTSPRALEAHTTNSGILNKAFDLKMRERIAIAVAEVNGCTYCRAAHAYIAANMAKLPPEEVARNRAGGSTDPKADAVVRFAAAVARERGRVSDADFAAVRNAGYSDAQIVEIVALVAEATLTNYLNEVAQTDVDFPVVDEAQAA